MTAFKKPLCGLLAIIFTFVFVAATPLSVFAEDEETTFSAQEIELNKQTDEDSGLEYIKVDGDSAIEIVGYTGDATEVKIPTRINSLSVISIGAGAFEDNKNIVEVTLHNDITSIGDGAFKNCAALKELKKTKSLEKIGVSCFEGCTSLETFTIPDNVTSVPEKCFFNCTSLKEVEEHKNLKGVAKDAFEGTAWENAKEDGPLNFGRILYSYKGELKDVVIPKGVSIIEDAAFLGCESLETLELGYDVEEIGLYAFQNCVNLKSVKVNDALGVVEAGAFKGCSSLKSMDFSNSTLATLGYEAFSDCVSLSEVKLCETISDIGDYAFQNTSIKTISFDKNVNSVGANAFINTKSFESFEVTDNNKTFTAVDGVLFNKDVTKLVCFPAAKLTGDKYEVPESVNEIGEKAFYGTTVACVTFSEKNCNLERIGVSAFENSQISVLSLFTSKLSKIEASTFKNSNLHSITLPDTLTYIGAEAFSGCASLAEIKIPESVYEIATAAFKDAGLKSANVGDGVAKIATEAFAGNKALADLYIGKNVEKIGEKAFAGCSALAAVNLPAALADFNANAFADCAKLAKITVDANNKNFKAVGNAVYSADGKTLVMVDKTPVSFTVADGTEVIAENAFDLAKGVQSITFPASLRNVKGNALDVTAWYTAQNGVIYAGPVLYKVTGSDVINLQIADTTKAIADGAVKNPAVSTVSIPEVVEFIGAEAFAGSGLVGVTIPRSVTYIGEGAFRDIAELAYVNLSVVFTVETLEASTFKNCAKLQKIVLPGSIKIISSDAFSGCISLDTVDLGSVEEIEQYAFAGCTALKTITIPATAEAVEAIAFYGCTALETIYVAEGNAKYKSLEDGVVITRSDETTDVFDTIAIYPAGKKGFYGVPETIKNIADKAFYNCDALTAITFADGFNNIGAEAFYDCDNITDINLPESVNDIGDYAFASCDNLRSFVPKSNLTYYPENTFDGCYYFSYEDVFVDNEGEGSGSPIIIIAIVVIAVGVVAFVLYNKKQKKIQQEIIENNKIKEAIEAQENE